MSRLTRSFAVGVCVVIGGIAINIASPIFQPNPNQDQLEIILATAILIVAIVAAVLSAFIGNPTSDPHESHDIEAKNLRSRAGGLKIKGRSISLEDIEVEKDIDIDGTGSEFQENSYISSSTFKELKAGRDISIQQFFLENKPDEVDWKRLKIESQLRFDHVDTDIQTSEEIEKILNVWYVSDNTWTTRVKNGIYTLINTSKQGEAKYVSFFLSRARSMAQLPISASIRVAPLKHQQGTSNAGAGILYRYNPTTKRYYVFCLLGQDRVSFYRKSALNGLELIFNERSDFLNLGGSFNKLSIIGHGNDFSLYVNDRFIRAVTDDQITGDGAGICVLGSGEFSFENYTIYSKELVRKIKF